MAQIAIIGTGYVGLVTGACLASLGHDVRCFDTNLQKIELLQSGEVPIFEAGLPEIIQKTMTSGNLQFVAAVSEALKGADFTFLCVPTPQDASGAADMSYVKSAAQMIAKDLGAGSIVINKSTVPIGTTELVKQILNRSDVSVISNPEFLREGAAVADFLNPDRIIVGGDDESAVDRVAELYQPIGKPILKTDAPSAEMIKYAANAFLATKISFINGIASICENVGADVRIVAQGLGADSRIGDKFLTPGPGWGGSCFPKDTQALLSLARSSNYQFHVLEGAYQTNLLQVTRTTDRILRMLGDTRQRHHIAVWGLTFKAGTDDLRESASISIIDRLLASGVGITAYDPTVSPCESLLGRQILCVNDPVSACEGANGIAVLTEWPEFSLIDPDRVLSVLLDRKIFDARGVISRDLWTGRGFAVEAVGVGVE